MTEASGSSGQQLADFLRSRRAAADTALLPGPVGLGPRRVPGLRREELAEAAGVSLTYYTRLEQGLATNPSMQVLDALARALGLDEAERAHLQRLASVNDTKGKVRSGRTRLRPDLVTLLDAMPDVAAVALSPLQDIIAWNRLGHALLASHLAPSAPYGAEPPNKVAMMFTDAHARSLHREWEAEATLAVASLRFVSAGHVIEADLARLVGNLSVASEDFAQLWAAQPVALCTHGTKRYHHPVVGRLDLHFQILHLPEGDGHRLLLHHAEPGSSDEAALRLLASTTITE
ncbi:MULTISPECIES: helix-turn-helix transcriptional regulator [Mycolicibacterium]|uniref:helix-turn-helix transcriptional regulator n=1 Tax=Mycolicibacterium TaxID=1866885 RepID=UPI001CFA5349|nr:MULTISPECIES: helix-turn-helix transcriptional regulator [Mycolicibacterium]MCX8558525.1 helix-turn-helix transcriptional regulator [Mycolicibacterium mucogenicum]UCZ63280.1 helix-turn-helix transcriptional regulator [Mycolicibacterium phocaicum]